MRPLVRLHLVFLTVLVVLLACSDPVRENQEAALGPEDAEGPSANHRRGQPCLVCHDEQGGAKPEMVVGGTIYQTAEFNAPGAEDVEVQFIDATGGGPLDNPITIAPSGNFYVTKAQWPDIAFPFKVRLLKNGEPVQKMQTTVNREGSCNFCHRPAPPGPDFTEKDLENGRQYYGQIYLQAPTP